MIIDDVTTIDDGNFKIFLITFIKQIFCIDLIVKSASYNDVTFFLLYRFSNMFTENYISR